MSDPTDSTLDNCGCCATGPVPIQIYNRPGLPALAYRTGTYASFLRQMLDRLGRETIPDGPQAGTRPLAALTTRAEDDPAIALLDASALVADVLTFYQERIANEGFLRTATERRSILELARAIGYELNPGVAASVDLAFTIDDAPGAPAKTVIPSGTKVQSVPAQGGSPQTFETTADVPARAAWNALLPRRTYPQVLSPSTKEVFLQGTATNLKPGDRVLLDCAGTPVLKHVVAVELQPDQKRTRVSFVKSPTLPAFAAPALPMGTVDVSTQVAFGQTEVAAYVQAVQWSDAELNAFLAFNQWDSDQLAAFLANDRARSPASTGQLFALRLTAGFFGNTAPLYASLPTKLDSGGHTVTIYPGGNWDGGWPIWFDQQTSDHYYASDGADVFLERVVSGLEHDSWVVFELADGSQHEYLRIKKTVDRSMAGFSLSNKVTGLTVRRPNGEMPDEDAFSAYQVRNTNAYLGSEPLGLVELPMDEALDADPTTLGLDGLALGLTVGQAVILTGERRDAPGVTVSEALTVAAIDHLGGFTRLTFAAGRQTDFKRSTLKINANVAPATHGETTSEILGNGDGSQANQRFTLKKPPLTYTAAPTPSGSASSLQLRINNLLWDEAASLYGLGPKDSEYIIRIEDDAKATVIFGDGSKGARLPTGINNVVATYRSGIGLAGEVDAGSLTILQSRPLGVRAVTNPLPAAGAADPEKMDDARAHAPLTVRSLDRIVSLDDYQDFASAFAGVGKAQAVDLWSGERHFVHLTIAGADGKPVGAGAFKTNFEAALQAARDPAQQVQVDTFQPLLFDLVANLAVDRRYQSPQVFAAARSALGAAFAFAKRGFGQAVTAAEVTTVLQDVPGVVFVDLTALYLSGGTAALNQILASASAFIDTGGALQQAQLLLINSLGVTLTEVKA